MMNDLVTLPGHGVSAGQRLVCECDVEGADVVLLADPQAMRRPPREIRPAAARTSGGMRRAIVLLLLVPTACASPAFGPDLKNRVVVDIGRTLDREAYAGGVNWGDWTTHVAEHRAAIDAADSPAEFTSAVNGALSEFGVSHLAIMSPDQARQRFAGTRVGIGVLTVPADDGLLLTRVIDPGSAHDAGLCGGDVVVAVNGAAVRSATDLAGELGERLTVAWTRDGMRHEAEVVVSESRRASTDSLTWIRRDVAVIAVHSFIDELYDRALVERLFDEAADARGVILDLRSNTGGNSDNTLHLAGRILPADTPLYGDVYRREARQYARSHPEGTSDTASILRWLGPERYYTPAPGRSARPPYAGPLVVLVDARSGSGGELVPAALQDHDRAVIVGTSTRGKVRIGDKYRLTGGYVLQLPVGEYATWGGRIIEDTPVEPDVTLSAGDTARDKAILAVAISVLDGAY